MRRSHILALLIAALAVQVAHACLGVGSWSGWSACSSAGTQTRTRNNWCSTDRQTQNCCYSTAWGGWGGCSLGCGGGTQTRTRTATSACGLSTSENQACNTHPCCVQTGWSGWGACQSSGIQTRTRTQGCGSATSENQACCFAGAWTGFGACSVSCGPGTQSRTRTLAGPCSGVATTESQGCNVLECCVPGAWNGWGACSVTVGTGTQTRTRTVQSTCATWNPVMPGTDSQSCCIQSGWTGWGTCQSSGTQTRTRVHGCGSPTTETQACCFVGDWTGFGSCSTTCGPGSQSRTRTLAGPCSGVATTDSQGCNVLECCVPGNWGGWGACSVSVGPGTQTRTRTVQSTCATWSPAMLGSESQACCTPSDWTGWGTCQSSGTQTRTRVHGCESPTTETQACCFVGDWTGYGSCSTTCGPGSQSRTRSLAGPCSGVATTESQGCDVLECCVPGEWSDWGACSVTISAGTQIRTRTVQSTCATWSPVMPGSDTQSCCVQGAWSEWGECDPAGTQSRTRTEGCEFPTSDLQNCCYVGPWGDYGSCSATCGTGTKLRSRSAVNCESTQPALEDSDSCFLTCCAEDGDLTYSEWSDWSTTCGSGSRTRTSSCSAVCGGTCPTPVHDDARDICCPVDGTWVIQEWSDWSTTCGSGVRTRALECTATCEGTCGPSPASSESRLLCCPDEYNAAGEESDVADCRTITICNEPSQYEAEAPTLTSDRACEAVSTCRPGSYEMTAATATSDRGCEACPSDTWQDAQNELSCKPCTPACAGRETPIIACTPISDILCELAASANVTMTLLGDATVNVEQVSETYSDAGVEAKLDGTIDITVLVVTTGLPIDTRSAGTYTVTYTLAAEDGAQLGTLSRSVIVADTTPPTITLRGESAATVELTRVYADPGASASDVVDGDLTASIVVADEGNGRPQVVGESYTIRYTVADAAGHSVFVERTVTVVPKVVVTISLEGDTTLWQEAGFSFAEPGFSASNTLGSVMTANVTRTFSVEGREVALSSLATLAPGSVVAVAYSHTDSYGEVVTASRTFTVRDTLAPVLTFPVSGGKLEYGEPLPSLVVRAEDAYEGDLSSIVSTNITIGKIVDGSDLSGYTLGLTGCSESVFFGAAWLECDSFGGYLLSCSGDGLAEGLESGLDCVGTEPSALACRAALDTTTAERTTTERTTAEDTTTEELDGKTGTDDGSKTADEEVTTSSEARVRTTVRPISCFARGFTVMHDATTDEIDARMEIGSIVVFEYAASDTAGNTASGTAHLEMMDTQPPAITLHGNARVTLTEGDVYSDEGAAATDTHDGDVSSSIVVSGIVNTRVPAVYTIGYKATDRSGNSASVSRTVTVEAAAAGPDSEASSGSSSSGSMAAIAGAAGGGALVLIAIAVVVVKRRRAIAPAAGPTGKSRVAPMLSSMRSTGSTLPMIMNPMYGEGEAARDADFEYHTPGGSEPFPTAQYEPVEDFEERGPAVDYETPRAADTEAAVLNPLYASNEMLNGPDSDEEADERDAAARNEGGYLVVEPEFEKPIFFDLSPTI